MNAEESLRPDVLPGETARRETLLAGLRALPQPAWILFFGTFLNKFGAFVVPFLTLYLTGRGYTVGEAGLAVGAYPVFRSTRMDSRFFGNRLTDSLANSAVPIGSGSQLGCSAELIVAVAGLMSANYIHVFATTSPHGGRQHLRVLDAGGIASYGQRAASTYRRDSGQASWAG